MTVIHSNAGGFRPQPVQAAVSRRPIDAAISSSEPKNGASAAPVAVSADNEASVMQRIYCRTGSGAGHKR